MAGGAALVLSVGRRPYTWGHPQAMWARRPTPYLPSGSRVWGKEAEDQLGQRPELDLSQGDTPRRRRQAAPPFPRPWETGLG